MLEFFAKNIEKVLTKNQIYQEVWKDEYIYDNNGADITPASKDK